MSAMMLTFLVPALSITMFTMARDYMELLWTTTTGLKILVSSYTAVGFGAFVLFKMTDVKLE